MHEPSRRQVRPLGVWLAVAAPLALAAFFVPQAIATHAQQWTGSGKVTFPLRAHLLHAKTVKVQGIRLAAGECNYSGTAVVHPGETAVQQDEVALHFAHDRDLIAIVQIAADAWRMHPALDPMPLQLFFVSYA